MNKSKFVALVFLSLSVFLLTPTAKATPVENGDNEWTAWLIDDCTELQGIGVTSGWDLDSYYKINASFSCLGETIPQVAGTFTGHIDGGSQAITNFVLADNTSFGWFEDFSGDIKDLTISGATISVENPDYFGIIAPLSGGNFIIDNVTLNFDISVSYDGTANGYVGGFVGDTTVGTCEITGSHINGDLDLESTSSSPIGLVGYLIGSAENGCTITDAGATGDITVTGDVEVKSVGGLVGSSAGDILTITGSDVTGDITVTSVSADINSVGGFVGHQVSDVSISNSTYTGNIETNAETLQDYVGGVMGWVEDGYTTLENVHVEGNITATSNTDHANYIGGLSGYVNSSQTTNSSYTGNIIVNAEGHVYYVGGLLGAVDSEGTLAGSYVAGDITLTSNTTGVDYAGGLVGWTDSSLTITNSHYVGNMEVSGDSEIYAAGGLVGYSYGYYMTNIVNSFVEGDINATSVGYYVQYVGGLVGSNDYNLYIEGSHYVGDIIVNSADYASYVAGVVGDAEGEEAISITNTYFLGDITIDAASSVTYIGGLSGYGYSEYDGVVSNSYMDGDINIGSDAGGVYYVGGLFGYASSDDPMNFTSSYYLGDIHIGSDDYVEYISGGIGYYNYAGNIDQTYAMGSITINTSSSVDRVGGLVAYDDYPMTLSNSFAQMDIDISGFGYVNEIGTLVGYNDGQNIVIATSYAEGSITINSDDDVINIAGLLGYSRGFPRISNSFSAVTFDLTSGTDNIHSTGSLLGGLDGDVLTNNYYDSTLSDGIICAGETEEDPTGCTAEVDSDFFKGSSTGALFGEWNFEDTWQVNVADYPTFQVLEDDTPSTWTLGIATAGTGTGLVTSSPTGVNCGSDCAQSYEDGTGVTLTASVLNHSTFTGWSGACTGTGTCEVTMDDDKNVTATFKKSSSGGGGGGGGSSGHVQNVISTILASGKVFCNLGDKFNSTTGLPCTDFTSSADSTSSQQVPASACSITLTLKIGMKGDEVKCLQTILKISADGIFGPMTKVAVKLFQTSSGLTADGVVGPKTKLALGL